MKTKKINKIMAWTILDSHGKIIFDRKGIAEIYRTKFETTFFTFGRLVKRVTITFKD